MFSTNYNFEIRSKLADACKVKIKVRLSELTSKVLTPNSRHHNTQNIVLLF